MIGTILQNPDVGRPNINGHHDNNVDTNVSLVDEHPMVPKQTLDETTTKKDVSQNTNPLKSEMLCVDGNYAVAHASYRINDTAIIYPITPSSPMAEEVDVWSSQHKRNIFQQEMQVIEMQSEAGAAGALHGALLAGSLATTYTASQGLLLFIPNMYKIAGELLPTVIHVASRALAGEALSIYGDHSDTMFIRSCGWAIVSSFTVQEAHDMTVITQIATLNSRVPFVHFMDGFRTSHEIQKIHTVSDEQLHQLIPLDKINEHRQRSLSPLHPTQHGTAQGPDVFMQLVESSNMYYNAVGNILYQAMQDFGKVTGRYYEPYEYRYYGTSSPRVAIISMGSSVQVIDGTLKYLSSEQVCLIGVRSFRPWSASHFIRQLPKTVQRVAVLDRTREGGAQGEPLYLDVCASLINEGGNMSKIFVAGGRYGLGSKDFTPRMVNAIILNMLRKDTADIQRPFTVGIYDDVTNLSLSVGRPINILCPSVTQCVFWGFGSDGTVGANKEAIKMIGNFHENTSVQGYFEYDAKKSSGWTVSHLRFSPESPIEAPFRIEDGQANYVACHNESYVQANKFDVIKYLKRRGTFFLNTSVASIADADQRIAALEALIAPKILRKLSLQNNKFYIMDAGQLASKFGLAGRINMICMSAFFRLSGVLPLDEAIALLKGTIKKKYAYKGDDVVKKNIELLDEVVSDPNTLILVDMPSRWRTLLESDSGVYSGRHITLIDDEKARKFMSEIGDPVNRLEGDDIPISTFLNNNLLGGVMIPGTSQYEKRSPNPSGKIPEWIPNNCTQCNQCVFVCPHAAIRPFVVTKDEALAAPFPDKFETLKGNGPELAGKRYTLQISVLDCTGCNACVEACPETPKALMLGNVDDHKEEGVKNWEYATMLPDRAEEFDKYSVRGSQFQTPLMEFSGACSGCGETPYFKLLTQLFGQRMIIANATGCSTIWGGSFPSNPYTTSKKTGRGPAWANSLFEDNAEFGLGLFVGMKHRREKLIQAVRNYVHEVDLKGIHGNEDELSLTGLFEDWLEVRDEKSDKCTLLFDKMRPLFHKLVPVDEDSTSDSSLLSRIWEERDLFPKLSHWITGGDGWAYDIGFGGLDHVEAFECNDVNILVVDTEMYSNTGGQQSKSTPVGATQAFASGGKIQKKKPLGEMMMTYEHVYVASVALSNMAQTLQALVEADRHDGPSIVIAYAPCIQQGVRPNGLNDMFEECSLAVDSGYWPLYRYNPSLTKHGQNPFILDSKKLRKDLIKFLQHENRFINLKKKDPVVADHLWQEMNDNVKNRLDHLLDLATSYKSHQRPDEAKVRTVFASETGTAARIANDFASACTESSPASALDDIELDDLDGKTTVFFIATCGQGAMPRNGMNFMKAINARTDPFTVGTKYSIFGLGDSSYYFFCEAAKIIDTKMELLGATKLLSLGIGDDSDEEGLQQGLHNWLDTIWPALDLPPPSEVPHIVPMKLQFSDRAIIRQEEEHRSIEQFYHSDDIKAISTSIVVNQKLCRDDYDRDFRTIQIAITHGLQYELGDALEIYPQNDTLAVSNFLNTYTKEYSDHTVVSLHAFGIGGNISLQGLFTYVLDLFGKPSRHFMQQLATFAVNIDDRNSMLDANFLKSSAVESGLTIADILLRYKDVAVPPLPALVAMIPSMKPRAYSIASTPRCSSTEIELLVLIDTWWCNSGERYGLTCNMLRTLQVGDTIWCRIKSGSMEAPIPSQPVICAGIGSGIAPHMAFLRDRVYEAHDNPTNNMIASFSLYFGNRSRVDEYLYQKELEEYTKKYPWFQLHLAFSRDNPQKKVYVQDLVATTNDACHILLHDPNGRLYICGNRRLPKPIQYAIEQSFRQYDTISSSASSSHVVLHNDRDDNYYHHIVQNLYLHGRVNQEVW